jgi:hypothetical protein
MKFAIIGVLLLAFGAGGMFYFLRKDDVDKKVKEVGNEINEKATKVGEQAKVVGKNIGEKAVVVGKKIGDKSVIVGKKIGDKSVELKDKTGELLVKGKDSVVAGYDATSKKIHDMAKMKQCPAAYDNMKKCYPKKFADIGKTKAVSKCSIAVVSGNVAFKKGLNCLAKAKSNCTKVKKCVTEEQMTALIAKIK